MSGARLALIGRPVKHTLSPRLFRGFGKALLRPVRYTAVDLAPERLLAALRRAAGRGWTGWNVTLPHKVAVMPALDDIAPSARRAGAVNVIVFREGRSVGHNTDANGFLADLRALGRDPRGRRAVVLGAGGAARAVCAALRDAGAAELCVLNRTIEKARALAEAFDASAGTLAGREALDALAAAELVVNATSAGLDGRSSPLPEGARWRDGSFAYDLVYRPRCTPFLAAAQKGGASVAGGLGMLVAQAAEAWALWFSEPVPAAVSTALRAELDADLV